MGKKNFDRKKAVRFTLVPGPIVDGKPTVLYQPVETSRKSKVSKKQRKAVVSKVADIQEITINGKVVEENQIPAFVLDQIRGRGDLIYNQMKGVSNQEQEGDLYEIQDGKQGDDEYEQYEIQDYDEQQKPIIREQQREYSDNQEEWQDGEDGEWSEEQQIEQIQIQNENQQTKKQKYQTKVEQFPTIQQTKVVNIEGKQYQLTKKQIEMLDIIIPQNYLEMDFGGLQFKKYNEDGLPLSQKEKYSKYLLGQNEQVVVIDTYEYIPPKPIDTYDSDLTPAQINKDVNLKEIEQALNYNGDQKIYQEIEDDFFAKMIQMQLKDNPQTNKPKTFQKILKQVTKQKIVAKTKQKKEAAKQTKKEVPQVTQKQLEQQLKNAVYNFEHNIQEKKDKQMNKSSQSDDQQETFSHNNHSMNFTDLQKREQYKGNDGELDWRCLTKKQKKQYMKTKVIQDFYDELRNRQIQQKIQGKNNVKVEELHLKQLVKHIPYQQDLVMQKALQQDLKKQVHLSDEDQGAYSSLSEEDDIVSFHQKTSILANNLSIIEQPRTKTQKPKKEAQQTPEQNNLTITKVVPEKRDKNETPEQRKARKQRLKQMKKQHKQQKKEFAQRFSKIKKQTHKSINTTNPLNKVSYVKIY